VAGKIRDLLRIAGIFYTRLYKKYFAAVGGKIEFLSAALSTILRSKIVDNAALKKYYLAASAAKCQMTYRRLLTPGIVQKVFRCSAAFGGERKF